MRLRGKASLLCALIALTVTASGAIRVYAQTPNFHYQSPSEYYISLRRSYPPLTGLTPDILAANPNAYRGATLEIEGRLSGVVRADDGGAFLMLSTDRFGTLTLKMSLLPNWVQPGVRLRVLVVVVGAEEGSVIVGIPDMQVVAVASATDIAAAEERWRLLAAKRAERERQRQSALRSAEAELTARRNTLTANRTTTSSRSSAARGGTARALNPGAVLVALSPGARAALPHYTDFVQRWNSRLSSGEAQVIAASILLFSEEYDVDPRLMVALIIAESDFRPQTTSNKGAMGLGQLMPDEVKDLGLSNPYDPVQNIYGSIYLMRGRLDKYSGGASSGQIPMNQVILALASYNAGMGAVKKYGGVPPYRETQNYVKKIERIYRQLCGEIGPS